MDLYRDFARKDELIDLMVNEVIAAAVLDELPPDWRDALTAIARALRAVCLAHPWMVTAAGQQALLGPNVMRHAEQSLQATAALGLDPAKRLAIWRAVDSYTMGHANIRPGQDHSEGSTATDPGRAAAAEAYLQDLADSGNFPNLAALAALGPLHNDYDEPTFETGLGWLLTGIAADTGQAGEGRPRAARSDSRRAAPQAATSTARSSPPHSPRLRPRRSRRAPAACPGCPARPLRRRGCAGRTRAPRCQCSSCRPRGSPGNPAAWLTAFSSRMI